MMEFLEIKQITEEATQSNSDYIYCTTYED